MKVHAYLYSGIFLLPCTFFCYQYSHRNVPSYEYVYDSRLCSSYMYNFIRDFSSFDIVQELRKKIANSQSGVNYFQITYASPYSARVNLYAANPIAVLNVNTVLSDTGRLINKNCFTDQCLAPLPRMKVDGVEAIADTAPLVAFITKEAQSLQHHYVGIAWNHEYDIGLAMHDIPVTMHVTADKCPDYTSLQKHACYCYERHKKYMKRGDQLCIDMRFDRQILVRIQKGGVA